MLKKLMMTTAAAALVAGSAVAQAPAPDSPKAPPMQKTEPMPAPGASPAQGSRQFVSVQASDQWLATKFKGTDVIGSNNEKIGDVTDLLIDQNGRIVAYIVGVGGFLGIGQKDVALAPVAFQVQPASDREELKLKLAMTRDELKNAPEFKVATRPAPTTGQAPPRAPATPPAR
jgi:sporulation protein YlmC with PRC-barrel domain